MIKRLLIMLLMGSCLILAVSTQAQAKDLFDSGVCTGSGTSNSAVCTDNKNTNGNQDPFSGKNGILIKVTNIVAYVGGAAAIIMIIVGALRFITSGSDVSTNSRTDVDVENARRTIVSALIGLAIIVLGRTIINFVLNRI